MAIKHFIVTGLMLTAAVGGGCPRIQEPWVQNESELQQERSRPAEAQSELAHRLLTVQVDR